MNEKTLAKAEAEAREFLRRVKELRDDPNEYRWAFITGGMRTGAIRRQSMELTRALSNMRRAN